MIHVEFTVEPFVEGQPGLHVTAAIAAAREHDVSVDIGPFGSSCDVEPSKVGALVGAVVGAAFANGATHVSVHAENTSGDSASGSEGSAT